MTEKKKVYNALRSVQFFISIGIGPCKLFRCKALSQYTFHPCKNSLAYSYSRLEKSSEITISLFS